MEKNKIRVADFVAQFLYEKGLNTISMVCAGSSAILNDAFYKHGKYQIIHSFRESNCAYHAIGYAKYTRKIGLINVAGGICGAIIVPQILISHLDKVPLLVISGSVALNQNIYYLKQKHNIKNKSYQGIQDGNNMEIVKSITNYSVQIQKPEDIKYELEKCLFFCQNPIPAGVFLEIPGDIQGAMINPEELKEFSYELIIDKLSENSIYHIDNQNKLIKLKELLNSKKPIILAGNGCQISNSRRELKLFAEKYQIPIVSTFLGTDLIEYDHPLYISSVGIKGGRSGNWALNQSDLILCLGSSLPNGTVGYDNNLFAPQAKLIVVDKNPEEHKIWEDRIELNINCDLREFFKYML